MAEQGSQMIYRHIQALKELEGKTVEAGWFESAQYEDGTKVAKVARINEFGGLAKIKAHNQTVYRSINESTGDFNQQGRFVKQSKSNFSTTHHVEAYEIMIPPRPFMRLAYANFAKNSRELQQKLAKRLFSGQITGDQILGLIGLALESEIVNSIKNGPWEANSPSTIAKKGFNKPLIDTAHMWQTVSSKVISEE